MCHLFPRPLCFLVLLHTAVKGGAMRCSLRQQKQQQQTLCPCPVTSWFLDLFPWLHFQLIGCFLCRHTFLDVGVCRKQCPAEYSFYFLITNHFLWEKSFTLSRESLHLVLYGYRHSIPCRANTVFPFLLFLTHLSARQGNYHVIYSRITALHTSLKWDCIIIPVSSVVTILLYLKQ